MSVLEILKYAQRRLPVLRPERKSPFELVGREEQLEWFANKVHKRISEAMPILWQTRSDRKSLPFQMVEGGSNAGKSRFVLESMEMLHRPSCDLPSPLKEHAELLSSCETFLLDFNGGKEFYGASLDAELLEKPEVFLGVRVATSWLNCNVDALQNLLPLDVQFKLTVTEVTAAIAAEVRSEAGKGMDAPVLMAIAADEYQLLAATLGEEFTAQCTSVLGNWMSQGSTSRGIMGMCLLAGTGIETVRLDVARYGANTIALPLLSLDDSRALILNYLQKMASSEDALYLAPDALSALLDERAVGIQIQRMIGLPGFLVWVAKALESADAQDAARKGTPDGYKKAAMVANDLIREQLQEWPSWEAALKALGREVLLDILLLSTSGARLTRRTRLGGTLTLEAASSKSGMIWTEPFLGGIRVLLQPDVQQLLAEEISNQFDRTTQQWHTIVSILSSAPAPFATDLSGDRLEFLLASAIAARCLVYDRVSVRGATKGFRLGDLFPGGYGNPSLLDTPIFVTPMYIAKEKKQPLSGSLDDLQFNPYGSSPEEIGQATFGLAELLPFGGKLMQNWDSAEHILFTDTQPNYNCPCADLRFIVWSHDGRRFIVFIQAKATRDVKWSQKKAVTAHAVAVRSAVQRWNKENPSERPLHPVFVWATTGPPKEELQEWACSEPDVILLDGGVLSEWCPLAARAPLYVDEREGYERGAAELERVERLRRPFLDDGSISACGVQKGSSKWVQPLQHAWAGRRPARKLPAWRPPVLKQLPAANVAMHSRLKFTV